MKRVILVHWNADEADERAARLREAGYDVSCHSEARANPGPLREDPPDAFVIDLTRIPSQGREIGGWLRRQKPTRGVPLVFIEGDPEKTQRVRDLLPDATFTSWEDVAGKLADAIERPLEEPAIPGAMDAYSSVPLVPKLGIAAGSTVALIHAPSGFEKTMDGLPDGAAILDDGTEPADVILLFETSVAALEKSFTDASARLNKGGRLWIAWPKRTSGVASDLSQVVVRTFGLARGFVDYKIASIDQTWSGLCFARRAP
jgi:CheY-like chemotaxis protein